MLSSDLSDLFIQLYDALDDEAARDGRADDWAEDETLQDIAEFVYETALRDGALNPEELEEQLAIADDEDGRRYAYLLGIDRALAHVHPGRDTHDRGALTRIAARYRSDGMLNTSAVEGALLPRHAFPVRFLTMPELPPTEHKADFFEHVTRIDALHWIATRSTRIERIHDVLGTARTTPLTVGCAPVIADPGEMKMEVHEDRRRYYRIAPRTGAVPDDRIRTIITRLDARGAEIAVLPELTLNPELLERWQAILASTRPSADSRLRLLMAGTGAPGKEGNRGYLLARTGDVLLVQDKRFPFTLDEAQLHDWGLASALGEQSCTERLAPDRKIQCAESSLGRIVILVCEDLGRTVEQGQHLIQLGPSHALAPVFSKPTLAHFWEHARAKELAAEVGTHVVVANSLVVASLQRDAGTFDTGRGTGTALGHSPSGQWEADGTEDPAEVILIRLAEGSVAPGVAT